MAYHKEDFVAQLKEVVPNDLKYNREYEFVEVQKACSKRLFFSVREYFPSGTFISGISADITFPIVENVLGPLYEAEGIDYSNGYTIKNSLNEVEGVDYNILGQEICDTNSFKLVSREILKLVDSAFSFFQKVDTLDKVALFVADKNPQEMVPYIQGKILFPKTILILKLAHYPTFSERCGFYYDTLKQHVKKKQEQSHLSVFEKLFCSQI